MSQNYEPKHLTILDPRTFDGDPFTVAQRAAEQVAALVDLSIEQAKTAKIMHRNSWMEAELQIGRELTPEGWESTPYARKWEDTIEELAALRAKIRTLAAAAGYDPKNPPKA